MPDDLHLTIDKKFRLFGRGILTAEEVVDIVLGILAIEGRYDLVEPTTRRLLQVVPETAVVGFVEWDDQRPTKPHRTMMYADSRVLYYHFNVSTHELWEELQSEAGQVCVEAYREELRGNVERVAAEVRTVLDEHRRSAIESVTRDL